MPSRVRRFNATCVLALSCSFAAFQPARAQFTLGNIGPSKGQVVGAAVGAGAAIAVIGVGIYFLARTPRVTGCLQSSNGGLELQGASPDQHFLLTGQTSGLAAGQRVRIMGKKSKETSGQHTLVVKSVLKNYGACTPITRTATLLPAASRQAVQTSEEHSIEPQVLPGTIPLTASLAGRAPSSLLR